MKNALFILFLCIFMFFSNYSILYSQATVQGPRMEIKENPFDAGRVNEGTRISHDFTIFNRGDEVLEIFSVSPCPDCAASVAFFDSSIPPDGKGKIKFDVNTTNLKGRINQSAVVHTNDPKADLVSIILVADVHVPIIVSPRYVLFTGSKGQSMTRTVEITAETDKPLELNAERFDLDGKIEYQIEEVEEGRKFKVHFTTDPDFSGSSRGFLNIKTNYDEKPVLPIGINLNISK